MKQSGRKQAMTNTFNRLLTSPLEYTPEDTLALRDPAITHCDLCGAALDYHFKLTHHNDANFTQGMSLNVGSDCIVNFAETYVPSLARQILLNVTLAKDKAKIKYFNENFPVIFEDFKEVNKKLNEYNQKYGWYFNRLKSIYEFKKNQKELIRKEYLSKPKVAEFYKLKEKIEKGKLENILEDHKNKNPESLFKNDPDVKFLAYFEKYKNKFFSYSIENMDTKKMYSKLEKQLYIENVKDKIKREKKY